MLVHVCLSMCVCAYMYVCAYLLSLSHIARETIKQESVLALWRVDVVLDQVHHNLIAHELWESHVVHVY